MRRLAFTLFALWAAVATSSFTARPQLPRGSGAVVQQELADAGPMHRSARAWRVVALVQAPQAGGASSLVALRARRPVFWHALRVTGFELLDGSPITAGPRRHYPLFPTGPPRVHAQA